MGKLIVINNKKDNGYQSTMMPKEKIRQSTYLEKKEEEIVVVAEPEIKIEEPKAEETEAIEPAKEEPKAEEIKPEEPAKEKEPELPKKTIAEKMKDKLSKKKKK